MIAALDWNAIAQMSVARILDCLIEGALIALFARLVLGLARQRNSGTRFTVWFSALMAIAALPILSGAWWSHGARIPAQAIAHRPAIVLPGSWALYLFAGWAAIAGWALLRVGAGLAHLHVLRRSCVSIDPNSWDLRLRETLARNRTTRPVALCLSDRVQVPTAIGLVKPAVVIPRWLMKELSPAELNQVLLHELAHLRRWDDWTNLAQKIVKALLFFHPAVWWIENKLSLEREMACDNAVLAETSSPRAYAECLARLAEKSFLRRSAALAQAAVGRVRQTSLRVAQILDANRPTGTRQVWKPAVSLVAGFAIACVICVSRAPRLVGFENGPPVLAASPAYVVASNTSANKSGGGRVLPTSAIAGASAWNAVAQVGPGRAAKTRNKPANAGRHSDKLEGYEDAFVGRHSSSQPDAEGLIHAASFTASPVAATETVLIVVEGHYGSTGPSVYQISVWRVTLQQPTGSSISKTIPRKET